MRHQSSRRPTECEVPTSLQGCTCVLDIGLDNPDNLPERDKVPGNQVYVTWIPDTCYLFTEYSSHI